MAYIVMVCTIMAHQNARVYARKDAYKRRINQRCRRTTEPTIKVLALPTLIVVPYIVEAYMLMVYMVMAYMVMACIVVAYIVMAYTVIASIVGAYMAMAYIHRTGGQAVAK